MKKGFSKDFYLVLIGQIISLFGNAVIRFALPLHLLSVTHSPSLLGIVSGFAFLPLAVMSPVGGLIADRVNIMRQIKDCKNDEARRQVANEAAYLYAPLAHKLGLYKLKSELEDLSLKYTEKEVYYHIKEN